MSERSGLPPPYAPPPLVPSAHRRAGTRRAFGLGALVVVGGLTAVGGAVVAGVLMASVTRGDAVVLATAGGAVLFPALVVGRMVRAGRRDPQALDWRPVAAGAYGPLAAVLIAFLAVRWTTDWRHRTSFTPAAWAASTPGMRRWMVHDLLDRDLLVGKTLAECEALLGAPFVEPAPFDWSAAWELGSSPGPMTFADDWLVVRAGADGRVTEANLLSIDW